jgi:pimeloyl-ACP methyl ester carboxylesterase
MARLNTFGGLIVALLTAGCATPPTTITGDSFEAGRCEAGIYGTSMPFVVITRKGDTFEYAFSDGRVGPTGPDSAVVCGRSAVRTGQGAVLARRTIRTINTRFEVAGATLAGLLIEPQEANTKTPLVVYAHGSEETGWIETARDPYQMVGRGVSVFVYDKRGTGQSTGAYSQNFPSLADDLVAASIEARRLASGRFGRFGLFGLSQGGWIAPLAAERAKADFIGIGYGLVVDILEEDASQVALELTEAGFDEDALGKARLLTDVTARLAVSNYTDGLDELDTLRDRFRHEPWYRSVRGGFTGVILGKSSEQLRTQGIPMFDRLNIDWSLDPLEVVRAVNVPQLWILAQDDREAPYEKTRTRLQSLQSAGKAITVYVFPDTDHGMWEYQTKDDGRRQRTRVTDGFYDLMADWAKGRLDQKYGAGRN